MSEAAVECEHEWRETEVGCEDCGTHPAVACDGCGEVVDLVRESDPRDDGEGPDELDPWYEPRSGDRVRFQGLLEPYRSLNGKTGTVVSNVDGTGVEVMTTDIVNTIITGVIYVQFLGRKND